MFTRTLSLLGILLALAAPSMADSTPPSQRGWYWVRLTDAANTPARSGMGRAFAWYLFPDGTIRSCVKMSGENAPLDLLPTSDVLRFSYRYWQPTTRSWVYVYQGPRVGTQLPLTIRLSAAWVAGVFRGFSVREYRNGVFVGAYWMRPMAASVAPRPPAR